MNPETTAGRAARAVIYANSDEPQRAWETLVELWPQRERELLDQDEYYDLDYSNAAIELASRLAIDLGKQEEFLALGNDRTVAGTALAYEYSQRGNYTLLDAHLDSSESAVDFLPYWRAVCSLMLNADDSAEKLASAIQWINENCDDEGYWADSDYVFSTAPQGAEPWDMRESLLTLAIDAGILPEVWDTLSSSQRQQLVEEHLDDSFYAMVDQVQVGAMKDRLRNLEADQYSDYLPSLLSEIESRLLLLEGKPLESTLAWLQQELSVSDGYGPIEQSLLLRLVGMKRVDLFEELSDKIPEEARAEQHEKWRKLAVDLGERNGDAVLANPAFEELDWEYDQQFLQMMHRCGIVASASKLAPVSTGFSRTPSLLLRLGGSWESAADECVENLDGWNRVDAIDRFPSALAAWTREDPQGYWTAVVYDKCPPGLDAETMPADASRGEFFMLIANMNSSRTKLAGTALDAFVTEQLAGWAAIDSVYNVSQSIAWPRQEWASAIRDHMATGRIDLRWVDYADCWRDYWPKYSLTQYEDDNNFVLNVGGIVERVRYDEVDDAPAGSESTVVYDWSTYRLSQPSISVPALTAGTHLR